MHPHRIARLAAGLALAAATLTAHAQNPGSGMITIFEPEISYDEGPNFGVNLTPAGDPGDGSTIQCNPAFACDSFALSIDLPDNIADVFPGATLRYTVVSDGNGAADDDYDFYMYDENGNYVSHSASGGGTEAISELAVGGMTERRFSIVYFTTTGSSYKGTYELRLGDPAPGADLGAFYGICEEGDEDCATEEGIASLKAGASASGAEAGAGGLNLLILMTILAAGATRRRRRSGQA